MTLKKRNLAPFQFQDPRQARIYRRLLSVGRGPAQFYADACRLMTASPQFYATTHLAAHLLREIESALRDVLETVAERGKRLSKGTESPEENHKAEIRAVLRALGIAEEDPIGQAWLKCADKHMGLAARTHRQALEQPRPNDQQFQAFFYEFENILDVILRRFEVRYLQCFQSLDTLLAKPSPSQADAMFVRKHVPNNPVALGYFFDRLTGSDWLEALNTAGFFRDPPQPEPNYEQGSVTFLVWPESRYLARVAALAPETVLKIVLQIPETDNVRVHRDLAEAACAMPANLAAQWARKEAQWISSQTYLYLLLPSKLADLIKHLAQAGEADAALELASSLLVLLHDPRSRDEPGARCDNWHYEEILKTILPDLVGAASEEALIMFCELLEQAIRLSRRDNEKDNADDSSYIWRRAIEEHPQDSTQRPKGLLVSAVRDAAEALVEKEGKGILDIVEAQPYKVFKRIGLHLRRKLPDEDPEGTARLVADPQVFDDVALHHELFHLLKEQFGKLPQETQEAYLALVEKGPAPEPLSGLSSPEEGERYKRYWEYTKLWPIQAFLEGKWRVRFDELKAEFREPEHPDFHFYIETGWVGPTTPKKVDQLRSMKVEEIVAFLRSWQPPAEPMDLSSEGLGLEISALVASEPSRFAAEAAQFQGLDPEYVRGFLSGIGDALKQGAKFEWAPVLGLCLWVVQQPREIPGRKGRYADLDPGWVWTRKEIVRLVSDAFEQGEAEIPFDQRASVRDILLTLTHDPQPSQEDEKQHDLPVNDPANLAINTVRGEAMHAVIQYAIWVKRHIEKGPDGKQRAERGFEEMPEVRDVLDRHLDVSNDASLAIRAVYGQRFPAFVWLDHNWARESVPRIFPRDEVLKDFRDVAWETYINFCRPFDNVFDMLREEYRHAINRLGTISDKRQRLANPEERLAEHLMVFYWGRKIGFKEPDQLLEQFFEKAPDSVRGHALEFVGHNLRDNKQALPDDVMDRLKKLWDWRLNEARSAASPASHARELAALGWWFGSGKLDDAWAVEQLHGALSLSPKVDADWLVVERLAAVAATMPLRTVQCLRLMVEGDKEGWRIDGWEEGMKTILESALQSGDASARQAAVDLVNLLGARGLLAFRDLLSGT